MNKILSIVRLKDATLIYLFNFFLFGFVHKNEMANVKGIVLGIWRFQLQISIGYSDVLEEIGDNGQFYILPQSFGLYSNHSDLAGTYVTVQLGELNDDDYPPWFGNEKIHASHRSNLLRKDPEFYGKYGWTEPDNLEYVWPV